MRGCVREIVVQLMLLKGDGDTQLNVSDYRWNFNV